MTVLEVDDAGAVVPHRTELFDGLLPALDDGSPHRFGGRVSLVGGFAEGADSEVWFDDIVVSSDAGILVEESIASEVVGVPRGWE